MCQIQVLLIRGMWEEGRTGIPYNINTVKAALTQMFTLTQLRPHADILARATINLH